MTYVTSKVPKAQKEKDNESWLRGQDHIGWVDRPPVSDPDL